jgi:hypothetical protein
MRPIIVRQWQRDLVEHPEWQNPRWFNDVLNHYSYYLWHYLYQDMLQKTLVVFAILLGVGGLSRESHYGTASFTLSLPISRARLMLIRGAVSGVQLTMLALLAIVGLEVGSAAIGESYPIAHASLHVASLVIGSFAALGISMAISSMIEGEHAPMLVGLATASLLYFTAAPYNDGGPQPPLVRLLNFQGALAGQPGGSPSDFGIVGLGVTMIIAAAALGLAIARSYERDY